MYLSSYEPTTLVAPPPFMTANSNNDEPRAFQRLPVNLTPAEIRAMVLEVIG